MKTIAETLDEIGLIRITNSQIFINSRKAYEYYYEEGNPYIYLRLEENEHYWFLNSTSHAGIYYAADTHGFRVDIIGIKYLRNFVLSLIINPEIEEKEV